MSPIPPPCPFERARPVLAREAGSLDVEELSFSYPPLGPALPATPVIDGLSLSAGPGEWLAVMGASDAGKTTLCLLASGLAPSLTGGSQKGHVRLAGRDTASCLPPALADLVGVLFQEPSSQLLCPTVEAEIAWGLENLGLPATEIRSRLEHSLARFGIEALRHRSPQALSGGEKKRLALASVLAMHPSVLVLDEPLGGLDPAGREEVLSTLSEMLRDRPATILMTESDPEAVATFSDRLAVLAQGRLVSEGPSRSVMSQGIRMAGAGVAIPQMAELAAALNQSTGSGFSFLSVDEARQALGQWLATHQTGEPGLPEPVCQPPASPTLDSSAAAVEIEGLCYAYPGQATPVLADIHLKVARGELIALVGANGSGKTTLVKHLNGLLRPGRGRIRVMGQDCTARSIGELARLVGFLFQSPEQQIFAATVRDEIAFGPRNLGLPPGEVAERVSKALERFDLAGSAGLPPSVLSYGLRRRLTLASLAAMDSPILVLDEPTVGLDAGDRRELVLWLREQQEAGKTVILVTHDMPLVAECSNRMVVLGRGEIVVDDRTSEVLAQPELLRRASLAPPPAVALAQALGLGQPPNSCLTVADLCKHLARLAGRA